MRILGIKKLQVMEQPISNKMVRKEFENILPIDAFITQRVCRYIRKTYNENKALPKKKMLSA